MIVQPIPVITKHRNEINRECLYAWYPEAISDTVTIMEPRDIYIHNGLDKDLLEQNPQTNGCKKNKDVDESRSIRCKHAKRTKEKFNFHHYFILFFCFFLFYSSYCCSNKRL
jgi:hypothetical protein